jgi:hypothetical protein
LVEVLLNIGGHLVCEYPWWNRPVQGVVLIFLFGYFHFYVACIVALSLETMRAKTLFVGSLYAIAIVANVIALGHLGWVY